MCLCGRCNAVLMVIKKNTEGLPVDTVLSMMPQDENGETMVDRWSRMKPSDSRSSKSTQAATVVPDFEHDTSENLREFFVPIGADDGEIARSVPEIESCTATT